MGYLNPLLELPAGQALARLPAPARARIEQVMRNLRAQANSEAERLWRRGKGSLAAYFRAASTYARHIAHAASQEVPAAGSAFAAEEVLPEVARAPCATARRFNPVLGLPAASGLLALSSRDRASVREVLLALGRQATLEAERSWTLRKGPMAAYHRHVALFARHLARALRPQGIDPA